MYHNFSLLAYLGILTISPLFAFSYFPTPDFLFPFFICMLVAHSVEILQSMDIFPTTSFPVTFAFAFPFPFRSSPERKENPRSRAPWRYLSKVTDTYFRSAKLKSTTPCYTVITKLPLEKRPLKTSMVYSFFLTSSTSLNDSFIGGRSLEQVHKGESPF